MDYIPPRKCDFAVDLESGVTARAELGSPQPVSGAKLAKTFFTKFYEGFVSDDEPVKSGNGSSPSDNLSNSSDVSLEDVKILINKKVKGEESADLVGDKTEEEKRKKTSAKKPPKPPRPPRGLSLDAADQKLIKELAELALMKRARIERMKALKKMRAAKASSSSYGNILAMLFTILFCIVILFQGMSSRSPAVGIHTSPDISGTTEGGFMLVHHHWNPSARDTNLSGSGSPSLVEQLSGLDPENKLSRAAG